MEIAKDTIITKSEFVGSTYLLNGKKLSLPVMEWFMRDYPSSYDAIQPAIITDQLSVATYSVGSIFLLGGLLVNQQDRKLSSELYLLGGITISSGVLLQIISASFQKKAVELYNLEVKKSYGQARKLSLELGLIDGGVGIGFAY